jgi:hypothetical protein
METTETEVQPTPTPAPEPVLILTREAQYYLQEAGKWANFLGIVGFIMCAIFLLIALFIGVIFSMLASVSPMYSQIPAGIGTFLSVIFILLDVLYFFFPFYLYQFAGKIKKGLILADAEQITQALSKLKSFFKLAGIVTVVMLCIYALELIGLAIAGSAFHH